MSSCSSSSSCSSVGYPNWVRGGLVAKLESRRGHKHLRSGNEEEKGSVGPRWRGETKKIEGGRRERKRESDAAPPRLSHFLALFLSHSLFRTRGCMRDCSRPWRAERGCCLGVHYSGLLISIHPLPSAHPTPPATVSEGEGEAERWRRNESARLTGGCSLSRASYLSFFLFLRPSTISASSMRYVNLHTD